MHKKHMFLRVFQKIALFACVFCAFFVSPVFATLPAGYTELEYIESTGTQYIDTGISTNENIKLKVKFNLSQLSATYQSFCAARVSAGNSAISQGIFSGGFYNNFGSGSESSGRAISINVDHIVEQSKSGLYIDNVLAQEYTNTTISTPLELVAFGRNNNMTHTASLVAKMYFLHIYDNDTLLRNFIPAKRNSDGEVGMYDTVSGTFFENAGTGNFIAGPDAIIKIATTKMVDEEFAAAEAKLAATVQTIESVVSRTITQTGQIQVLQDTKQTRPDESCPANMKCLLVQDEDGTPHWYPIIEP